MTASQHIKLQPAPSLLQLATDAIKAARELAADPDATAEQKACAMNEALTYADLMADELARMGM
jgi:hypothetical protein